MQTEAALKTDRLNREDAPDALYQTLFAWGKRLWSASGASESKVANQPERDGNVTLSGRSVTTQPVLMAKVSFSTWQQQTMTQLTHALMLNLSKHGRDTDAAYVMHLHQIQREGEISVEQCLDRLQRLCPDEMAELPTEIRAKLSSIKAGIH